VIMLYIMPYLFTLHLTNCIAREQASMKGYGAALLPLSALAAGGNVPVVYQFKPGQGSPTAALSKLLAGVSKPAKAEYKLDAVFLSTSNLSFVAGEGLTSSLANSPAPALLQAKMLQISWFLTMHMV